MNRIAFIGWLALLWAFAPAVSARPTGLVWTLPASEAQARVELERISSLGFEHLIVIGTPSAPTYAVMETLGIRAVVQVPLFYLTPFSAGQRETAIASQLDEMWGTAGNYALLQGISVFWEGSAFNPELLRRAAEWRPGSARDDMLFYVASMPPPEGYSIPHRRLPLAYRPDKALDEARRFPDAPLVVVPKEGEHGPLHDWYRLLSSQGEGRVYFPAAYVLNSEGWPTEFTGLVQALRNDPDFVMPRSDEDTGHPESGYSVLLYVILLITVGMHYAIDPTYRKSINRFFQSNRFFVDDLVNRRLKLSISNYIVAAQLCLLYGIAAMAFAEFGLSEAGIWMVGHFLPIHSYEAVMAMFLVAGTVLGIVLCLLLILWGGFMNRDHCQINHYATILLWPQQLLLVLVPVYLVLMQLYPGSGLPSLAWTGMLVLPGIAYVYASAKLMKHSYRAGLPYLVLSFLPPFALLSALAYGILFSSPFPDLFDLAIHLP